MTNPSVYHEAWLPSSSDSFKFYTRTYSAQDPHAVVVFVHGFAEHVSRAGYEAGFKTLASKGITIFAFDQRGFGKTAVESEKRRDGSYARTSWPEAMDDIHWAVQHMQQEVPGVPLFIMGHSMGGGLTFGICTRSPNHPVLPKITGIITTSPLVLQTKPSPHIARWLGGKLSHLTPHLPIPAPLNEGDLSHDPASNQAYVQDPLIKTQGTLVQLRDMLDGGEELLKSHYRYWPPNLPVLCIHGSDDKVASCQASQEFCEKIVTGDKTHRAYEGGYHELWNEPNGVKEKLVDEIAEWILAHSPSTKGESPTKL